MSRVSPRSSTCHPDRPLHAAGLCKSCAGKKHYRENRARYAEKRERLKTDPKYQEYQQEYRKKHQGRNVQYGREYRDKYKDELNAQRRSSRFLRVYGLTKEQILAAIDHQQGGCKICQKPLQWDRRNFNIDHCHKTGRIRGLLCVRCNTTLGFLENARERLSELLDYCDTATLTSTFPVRKGS